MAILGIILIIVGVLLFFAQKSQKNRAFSIRSARSATVAELTKMAQEIAQEIGGGNWREYVKLAGTIQCDRPMDSPLKQESCVHYRMEVKREYEEVKWEKDSEGNTKKEVERGTETVSSNRQSVPFFLEDASGRIEVNPDGADIETIKVLDEFRQEQPSGGLLSFGNFSLTVGNPSPDRRTLGYRYSEWVLPAHRKVLVIGMVSDQGGTLTLQNPTDDEQKFIISLRSEEELKKAADRNAQTLFYVMVGLVVLGVILILVDLVS